jgi:hypothetical protein
MISKITPEKITNKAPVVAPWNQKTIPFLGGRPKRDSIISNDDIMNLLIACNTCQTLDEFFSLT